MVSFYSKTKGYPFRIVKKGSIYFKKNVWSLKSQILIYLWRYVWLWISLLLYFNYNPFSLFMAKFTFLQYIAPETNKTRFLGWFELNYLKIVLVPHYKILRNWACHKFSFSFIALFFAVVSVPHRFHFVLCILWSGFKRSHF